MLDSSSKTLPTHAAAHGRVLWRGAAWSLIESESHSTVADQTPSASHRQGLAELTSELTRSQTSASRLVKALAALDAHLDSASGTQAVMRSIDSLVQNGDLHWLPCDALPPQEVETALDSGDSPRRSEKKTSKKTSKKAPKSTPIAEQKTARPTPSTQKPGSVSADSRAHGNTPANSTVRHSVDLHSQLRNGKSLIELFTSEDAVTGAPESRWLSCVGYVPVAALSTAAMENSDQKIVKKPAKLSSGRVSPKNPKLGADHCTISLVNGEELLRQTDFELPGPIALPWQRTYRTSHSKDFGLGIGWTSLLLSRLDLRENEIIYCDGDGREIPFERTGVGGSCRNSIEHLDLYCDDTTVYRIMDSGDNRILTFGGTGKRRRLHEIADRHGHAIKLFYSANDRLIQILDSAGRRLKINYNISDQVQKVSLCNDNGEVIDTPLVEYAYNDDRDLTKVIDANGNAQTFEYRHHIIAKHTSKDGFNTHFLWDEYTVKGKCVRHWGDNDVYNYHFKYDEVNKITRCTDARGNTSEYHYNDLGLITTEIDPEGGVSQFQYDDDGRLLSERNPIGNTTLYTYDTRGLLSRVVDADGSVTLFEYDGDGNLITTVDPLEQPWVREYNDQGRITLTKDPNGDATQYRYDDNGRLATVTDTLGRSKHFEWNGKGELIALCDAAGHKTHYVHDSLGRITKIIESDNRTTHYSYDRMCRVTQIIQANGLSVQMQYTPQGNLTQYIDVIGRSTRYKYDGLSQPIERIDPAGQSLLYEYDKQRNLTALINENGERHELEYDKNQRLIKETGFDGRVQQYNYNAGGQLVRHLDGAHRVTSFKRDPMGRLMQKRTSTGEITQYEYDEAGRLSKAYNNHSVLHFRYDCYGQLIGEMQNHQRIQHRYSAFGQKTHTVLPNGKTVRYDYDERGLLVRVSYSGRMLCNLTRDTFGQEIHRTTGEVSSQFEYDPMGRLLRQCALNQEIPLVDRHYRYDKIGNLRQIDDLNDGRMKMHYDALDRLQQVEGHAEQEFTFDAAGNLLDSQYPEPEGFVQGNRLRVFHNYRFEYDDVGNLVRQFQGKLETRLYYNVANQLVRIHKNNQIIEYRYDPLGRRIRKKDSAGETVYLWDGECLLQESRDHNDVTYIHEPGRSLPLLQLRDEEVYYFHTDQSGTALLITAVQGDIVWKVSYDVFGAVTQTDVQALDNPIRFHGLYYDAETGLLYGQQRYYHPVIGRFTQQNPLGREGGTNNYIFNVFPPAPLSSPAALPRCLLNTGFCRFDDKTAPTQPLARKRASLFGEYFAQHLTPPADSMNAQPLQTGILIQDFSGATRRKP